MHNRQDLSFPNQAFELALEVRKSEKKKSALQAIVINELPESGGKIKFIRAWIDQACDKRQ